MGSKRNQTQRLYNYTVPFIQETKSTQTQGQAQVCDGQRLWGGVRIRYFMGTGFPLRGDNKMFYVLVSFPLL